MNKEQKEQFKKEKIELLDMEILALEKEKENIQVFHEQKLKGFDEKLEILKLQKDAFKELKIK